MEGFCKRTLVGDENDVLRILDQHAARVEEIEQEYPEDLMAAVQHGKGTGGIVCSVYSKT